MTPESPVIPNEDPTSEIVFARDQPAYIPLPSLRRDDGVLLTRWEPNDAELVKLVDGGDLVVWQWTGEEPQLTRVDILTADAAREMFEAPAVETVEIPFFFTASDLGYYRFSFTNLQRELLWDEGKIFIWICAPEHLHPLRPEVVRKTAVMPPAVRTCEGDQNVSLISEIPQ